MVWSDDIWPRYNYLTICNLTEQKNLNIEKIALQVVQLKYFAMHNANQNYIFFDIFTVENLQNLLNVLMIFGKKSIILTHTIDHLAIATNIPQRLKTGFMVQSHI